jgi:hypothetical protein
MTLTMLGLDLAARLMPRFDTRVILRSTWTAQLVEAWSLQLYSVLREDILCNDSFNHSNCESLETNQP